MSNARVTLGAQEGVTGASSGAKIGGTYGGPVGAMWGAIIGGIVGTATGIAMGGSVNKAKSYQKQAAQLQQAISLIQRDREREAYRQQLITEIRRDRIQRASNLSAAVAAGVEEGSAARGTLSAIGSSIANNVQYMANDRAKVELMQFYGDMSNFMMQKASKKYRRAQNIKKVMDPIGSTGADSGEVISSFKGMGNMFGGGGAGTAQIGSNIGSQLADVKLNS